MMTYLAPTRLCRPGVSRRDVLRVGCLAFGGLSLADLLRSRAIAGTDQPPTKSVIMIWLRGGASHIDSYDMKPDAPAEVRGEFNPVATKVPGIEICEYLPKHAQMMDRLTIIRGIRSNDLGDHTPHYILTGFPDRGNRPPLGSVVSYLKPLRNGLPTYVSTMYDPRHESPLYTGSANRPFEPRDEGLDNLSLSRGVSLERLQTRRQLLAHFDGVRKSNDLAATKNTVDEFTRRAIEMIASPRARDAFDLGQESPATHARYGRYCENFLLARRLVEAGISVVSLKVGDWDTHEHNFRDMREQLPQLDQGFHALVSDLYDRGLERDVAVVMWGEFGRAPRITRIAGRDHWPEAGAAVLAGGGFKTGQVIGETDSHAAQAKFSPHTPSNILVNLYRHLGIDPSQTIPGHDNRPMHVLDEREPVRGLM